MICLLLKVKKTRKNNRLSSHLSESNLGVILPLLSGSSLDLVPVSGTLTCLWARSRAATLHFPKAHSLSRSLGSLRPALLPRSPVVNSLAFLLYHVLTLLWIIFHSVFLPSCLLVLRLRAGRLDWVSTPFGRWIPSTRLSLWFNLFVFFFLFDCKNSRKVN